MIYQKTNKFFYLHNLSDYANKKTLKPKGILTPPGAAIPYYLFILNKLRESFLHLDEETAVGLINLCSRGGPNLYLNLGPPVIYIGSPKLTLHSVLWRTFGHPKEHPSRSWAKGP